MTNNQSHRALVEKVARIIDPTSFGTRPADYGFHGEDAQERFQRTLAYGGQLVAINKAKAAIAAVYEALREPSNDMVEARNNSYADHYRIKNTWVKQDWAIMLDASPLKPVVPKKTVPCILCDGSGIVGDQWRCHGCNGTGAEELTPASPIVQEE